MICRALLIISCVIWLSSCGPTHQDIADEYKLRILQKKADIVVAAQYLETQDKGSPPRCEGTRIPLVYSYYGGPSNTTIAMHDWLLNLDDPFYEIPFNLTDSHILEETLDWSSTPNPRDSIKDDQAEEDFRDRFEYVLQLEYLVLNTAQDFQEPQMLPDNKFLPGSISITMYIVSIDNPAILCRADFNATTAEEVTSYQLSELPDTFQGNFAIRRSLSKNAREAQQSILLMVSDQVDVPSPSP